jgi:hypothetical protein
MDHRSRRRRWILLLAAVGVLAPEHGAAQSVARVRSEENVRRAPNGEVLARVAAGTQLPVVSREGQWLAVDLEGWVWSRSLQVSDRDGFDLVVVEPQGENLRSAPSGDIRARLGRGMLLDEVERRPGWIRVRRRAWIWSESVVETSTTPQVEAPAPEADRPARYFFTGDRGAVILTAPDGDTVARASPRSEVAVLAREGNWARVRVEGWAWLPASDTIATSTDTSGTPPSPADLGGDPDRYRGTMVTWELQFISLERAEAVRTDFFEGEPYLLTRFGGAGGAFVYVAVPPERVQEVSGLAALERLRVSGRVRTGASSLTGSPIIELRTFERVAPSR